MSSEFFLALLTIVGIDIILGGDNAIVVALACRNLPPEKRNKAIFFGILLAIIARIFMTFIAVLLLNIPFLMALGGVILLWIAFQLMITSEENTNVTTNTTTLGAIKTIIIADIVMGFDNVLAIAGAANGNHLLIVLGLIISIPIILWGSKLILFLMKRFPFIVYIGASILIYTAAKMIMEEPMFASTFQDLGWVKYLLTFLLVVTITCIGWVTNRIRTIYTTIH
ncbi:TerC family protein [Texcoconibacillus texcoconensis]|uniref:YjbE family integral membrane protein n=1 Tax=Texcoconibacillus texcoconensis TaxID=1095777 RepID=A0A840QTJ7_9BACI|nr:TerC family protein [Texcoconibacillus texcoconensis]MBB5174842.1 YjbE family integral membrane protein [Texcoconibacillus texcoconensis]